MCACRYMPPYVCILICWYLHTYAHKHTHTVSLYGYIWLYVYMYVYSVWMHVFIHLSIYQHRHCVCVNVHKEAADWVPSPQIRNTDIAEHPLTILPLSVDCHIGREKEPPVSVLPLSGAATPRLQLPSTATPRPRLPSTAPEVLLFDAVPSYS